MGVEVRCATAATAIDADGITVRNQDGEERIEARTKVWAAGVQASPLAKMLAEATGAETDRAGRILVEPDCTLPGHPEVFAIGDMVSLNGLPGIAQPALQEGKYVGKVIRARLDGDTSVAPFKYFDKGTMATIGRTHAVARSGGMSFTGITAYLMWAFIHVLYLIGWGNRFGTLYSWGRSLWFTKNRAHRIITLDQAIDEIGVHGSAPADTTRSDIGSSDNGARQPSTTL
jgi:NADH dehydrogenase